VPTKSVRIIVSPDTPDAPEKWMRRPCGRLTIV
jgi:hypothetical protein